MSKLNKPRMTQIFEYLRKGKFISDNTNEDEVLQLFDYLNDSDNFEAAKIHFDLLGITLEDGEGYFYFSRPNQPTASLENKIKTAHVWIDILDFFKTYDNDFGVGTIFEPADIKTEHKQSMLLREKLNRIGESGKSPIEQIKILADKLVSDDFAIVDKTKNEYKVLSAFRYLERLVNQIHIPEDETAE